MQRLYGRDGDRLPRRMVPELLARALPMISAQQHLSAAYQSLPVVPSRLPDLLRQAPLEALALLSASLSAPVLWLALPLSAVSRSAAKRMYRLGLSLERVQSAPSQYRSANQFRLPALLERAPLVSGDANVPATTNAATTALGAVSVSTGTTVSPSGLVGTSAVGTVTTSVSETIYVTGVEATTYVGNVLVWSRSAPASTSWSDAGAATSEWTDADPATTEWEKIA